MTADQGAPVGHCFVTRRLPGDALQRLTDAFPGVSVDVWPEALPPSVSELHQRARDADVVLCLLTDAIDDSFFAACPNVRGVSVYAVGYDNVDLSSARRAGAQVGHTPDVLTDATADLAFALMLAAARRLSEGEDHVREGHWQTWDPTGQLGQSVHGATLAVIGAGRIGNAVAQRAEGFAMNVLRVGRNDGPEVLDDALSRSDFVSLHCPLTPATRHLINARTLALMKPTAIIVNTARGGLVDQTALAQALREEQIFGAALDVTDPEPLPPTDPLLSAPNLLVVPHIGSATWAARTQMAEVAVENAKAALAGRRMPHLVPELADV